MLELCVRIAEEFAAKGHRGEQAMALAAKAHAARQIATGAASRTVDAGDIGMVARMAIAHRRPSEAREPTKSWTPDDEVKLKKLIAAS
jgi:hypothetical protein